MQPEDLERLVTWAMPFGKYKGRRIADLPGNYLNWFAREGFPDGEIGRLLALMQEIDHNGLRHLLEPIRTRTPTGLHQPDARDPRVRGAGRPSAAVSEPPSQPAENARPGAGSRPAKSG